MAIYTSRKLKCYQWICSQVRPIGARIKVTNFEPATKADWGEIIFLGSVHGVLPRLYLQLNSVNSTTKVPQDFLEALEGFYELNKLYNFKLRNQVLETTRLLNQQGIKPIWLKGAITLLSPQWEKSPRTMLDLDLYIADQDDQVKTLNSLSAFGYNIQPESVGHDYTHSQHFAPVIKPGCPARLEVHKSIAAISCSDLLSNEQALANIQWISTEELHYGILSNTDQIMQSYLQCTEQASDCLHPRTTPRLMKILDFLDRFSTADELNIWFNQNRALQESPWNSKAGDFASHLDTFFGYVIDHPKNSHYVRRIKFTLNFPKLDYANYFVQHGWHLLKSGKLGRVRELSDKILRQIALVKSSRL